MLVVWFALPICDAIGAQNFLGLIAYFDLSAVADKLGQCSSCPNLVLESIDELPISFDGVDISNEGFNTDKNLGDG